MADVADFNFNIKFSAIMKSDLKIVSLGFIVFTLKRLSYNQDNK